MRHALCALIAVTACSQPAPTPPAPAPPAVATFVSASFDLTWTAALDHLAVSGVRIASRDRSAGLISTERVTVEPSRATEYADCGSVGGPESSDAYLATSVVYDVVVRDDGRSSSVLVTAAWKSGDASAPFPCETKGVWEADAQEAIKLAAEANR